MVQCSSNREKTLTSHCRADSVSRAGAPLFGPHTYTICLWRIVVAVVVVVVGERVVVLSMATSACNTFMK